MMKTQTFVKVDGREYCVSTVELPFVHIGGGFETMVFPARNGKVTGYGELFCDRYKTASEAAVGHKATVAALEEGRLQLYTHK